jgi:hypothetical protein
MNSERYLRKYAAVTTFSIMKTTGNNRLAEILASVRALAVEYYALTGKPLGVTGELAEAAAAEALGLELVKARMAGYDAIRRTSEGLQHVQIKGRACSEKDNPGARLGVMSRSDDCHVVMMVLLDKGTLQLREIWEAPYAEIDAALNRPGSKARNERRQISVGSFRRLKCARRIWPAAANVGNKALEIV